MKKWTFSVLALTLCALLTGCCNSGCGGNFLAYSAENARNSTCCATSSSCCGSGSW